MSIYCPLSNLGNTCFINACVQILAHLPELDNIKHACLRHAKKSKPETKLLFEWFHLYDEMNTAPSRRVEPLEFVKAIHELATLKRREIFRGWAQNDMPEFLMFLIEAMHESICRPVHMTISGKPGGQQDKTAIACYRMLEKVYSKEYSELMHLFYGISVTEILPLTKDVSPQTKRLSICPEHFFVLDLPVPNIAMSVQLTDCFEYYCEPETLTGDNAWWNEKTQSYQSVLKRNIFWNFPDILVIQLNRAVDTGISGNKLNILVEFPITNLDLSPFVIGYHPNTYVYDLVGLCNHSGSQMGGHYTACVKQDNKWFHYNDTKVEYVGEPGNMVSPYAYCLFYRKKNANV